ncbi:hypothetical protein PVL29_008406 [Vitis rotundifolia]|uniref:FLZ-type domain-containing protein n=1 Tax=Vitis rotundifolia TaxID=103349 RepID=A0AA38ZXH9_VITRO|nr:hypothetical protein PVL29_008406 [Vitis rotundifolia]
MPVKRSRVGRSSSFGDAGFLSQVPTPEHRWDKRSATPSNSAKILKPSDVAGDQQARPTILTVASPEMDRGRVDVSFEKPIGAFLEKCYYCNSKIRENVEVFMYGQVSPLAMGSPDLRWEKHSAIAAETASANGASDSAKILKPSELVADHQSRPKILTVASPETVKGKFDESFEGPIGGFLQKCYYCKKKIHENAEVFMYGYLHAFCTSECRDRQIIFDKELEKASAKPIEAMNEHRRVNRMKNQFGFQLEKKAAP